MALLKEFDRSGDYASAEELNTEQDGIILHGTSVENNLVAHKIELHVHFNVMPGALIEEYTIRRSLSALFESLKKK